MDSLTSPPLREELGAQSLSDAPPSLLASVFLFHKRARASSAQSADGPSRLGWAGGLRTSRSSCPEGDGPACLVVGLSGLCLASWTTSGEEGGTLTSHPCSLVPLFGAAVTLCLLEGPGQKACERGSLVWGGSSSRHPTAGRLGLGVGGGRGLRVQQVGPQALTQPPGDTGCMAGGQGHASIPVCVGWHSPCPPLGHRPWACRHGLQPWVTGSCADIPGPRQQGQMGPSVLGSPVSPTAFLKQVHGPWWSHRVPRDTLVNCVQIKSSSVG